MEIKNQNAVTDPNAAPWNVLRHKPMTGPTLPRSLGQIEIDVPVKVKASTASEMQKETDDEKPEDITAGRWLEEHPCKKFEDHDLI